MTHFYLTLLSNASLDYYPDNKPQSFKTKLSKPLDLTKEDYEVGLVEIQYPCTWYTLKDEDCYIALIPNLPYHIAGSGNLKFDFKIPPGMYNNIEDIIKEINNTFKEKTDSFIFKIQPHTFKTIITKNIGKVKWKGIEFNFTSIAFTKTLCHILGFDTHKRPIKDNLIHFYLKEFNENPNELISKYPSDINSGMYSLFVYSDLVSSQAVGDAHAPLLKTVSIKSKLNTVISQTYDLPHYLPIQKQIFDTIEIDIRDDSGELIPFTYGKVLIKLHFRLRRSPYFE